MFVVAKGTKAGKSQMKAMGTIKIVALLYPEFDSNRHILTTPTG
jgi:hypothetical protein